MCVTVTTPLQLLYQGCTTFSLLPTALRKELFLSITFVTRIHPITSHVLVPISTMTCQTFQCIYSSTIPHVCLAVFLLSIRMQLSLFPHTIPHVCLAVFLLSIRMQLSLFLHGLEIYSRSSPAPRSRPCTGPTIGGRLERSLMRAQNPLLSWFPCPECFP